MRRARGLFMLRSLLQSDRILDVLMGEVGGLYHAAARVNWTEIIWRRPIDDEYSRSLYMTQKFDFWYKAKMAESSKTTAPRHVAKGEVLS